MALIDLRRGPATRSAYVRALVLGGGVDPNQQAGARVVDLISPPHMPVMAPVTQQDAPSAPIESAPVPAPPAKRSLRLEPGQRELYEPRGRDWGTVRCDGYEFDVTGVELEEQADGSTVLRFADRSLVRVGEG